MKILFVAANPPETTKLQLDKEIKKIDDSLQRSKLRDQFQLVSKWAVDSETLLRALLAEEPDIVHFSGHGEGQAGLVLVGQDGKPKPATAEALSGLFKQFPKVKCVLLNACYAEVQAKAIVQHIDHVIGMRQEVRDDAAIAFATGFYDGLGYGKPIDVAFELGCVAIQFELASFSSTTRKAVPVDFESAKEKLEPLADHLIPVLLRQETGFIEPTTGSLSEKLRTTESSGRTEVIQQYRERVKEFLADRELTPIEEFQLATLANVLGLSEAKVNQILEEEQNRIKQAKENYKQVLTQTIQKGFYPFNEKIQAQLQDLQKVLELTDLEIQAISNPILKIAEAEYQGRRSDTGQVLQENLDLTLELALTRDEMVTGVEKTVFTGSENISVKVPPGISIGKRLRVKGKGRLNPRTQQRGDLYLKLTNYLERTKIANERLDLTPELALTEDEEDELIKSIIDFSLKNLL